MSQTLCNIEVLPAFALPIMSTLNLTFGARGLVGRVRDEVRDGAKDGVGNGARDGVGNGAKDGAKGGARDGARERAKEAGDGDGTGAGDGAGPKQQINCFTPIARK